MASWGNSQSMMKGTYKITWSYVGLLVVCLVGIHFILQQTEPGQNSRYEEPSVQPQVSSAPAKIVEPVSRTRASLIQKPQPTPAVAHMVSKGSTTFAQGQTWPEFAEGERYDGIPNEIIEHVAICISVKDQADDLVEFFVHHYHNMGIHRFYVMDDGSDPPLSTHQYPGIPRGALTFVYQDRAHRSGSQQMVFYVKCIESYRSKHTWMAFIDSDEFFDTPGSESLSGVLRSFEDDWSVGALGVNWRVHTSSGLKSRPESVRQSFVECLTDDKEHDYKEIWNAGIKTIMKMTHAAGPINPHKFNTLYGSHTVGENGDILNGDSWRRPITRDRIGLHHYALKSREEYEAKMHRGNGMSDPKKMDFWNRLENEIVHVNCTEMTRYLLSVALSLHCQRGPTPRDPVLYSARIARKPSLIKRRYEPVQNIILP